LPGRETKPVNRDFSDLLAEVNAQGVEYLVVGAYALAVHGHVRAVKDLDVWVRPEEHMIKNKRATGCIQDAADVERLETKGRRRRQR
jgi:hypothetical protein